MTQFKTYSSMESWEKLAGMELSSTKSCMPVMEILREIIPYRMDHQFCDPFRFILGEWYRRLRNNTDVI